MRQSLGRGGGHYEPPSSPLWSIILRARAFENTRMYIRVYNLRCFHPPLSTEHPPRRPASSSLYLPQTWLFSERGMFILLEQNLPPPLPCSLPSSRPVQWTFGRPKDNDGDPCARGPIKKKSHPENERTLPSTGLRFRRKMCIFRDFFLF